MNNKITISLLCVLILIAVSFAKAQYCVTNLYLVGCNGPLGQTAIDAFSLGTINQGSTGCTSTSGALGYSDYTSLSTVLTPGSAYMMTFTLTGYAGNYVKSWIDYNDDFLFDDATEMIGQLNNTGTGSQVINFTVPAGSANGTHRLRLRMVAGSNPFTGACSSQGMGEIHDYTVVIQATSAIDAGVSAIISPALTIPNGYVGQPDITVKNYGTTTLTMIGVSYRIDALPVVSNTLSATILPGGTANVLFPSINFPSGTHTFCAWTTVAGDVNQTNDTLCEAFTMALPLPDPAGTITSPGPNGGSSICFPTGAVNSITNTYNVPAIANATYYIWSYTGTGVTITGSTNSVSVTFSPSATSGNLTVKGHNSTGDGTVSPNFPITVIQNCNAGIALTGIPVFQVEQNNPNPSVDKTRIIYSIPSAGEIRFDLLNLLGQNILTYRELQTTGKHDFTIRTEQLANGVYYYSVEFKGMKIIRKLMVNK